MSEFRTNLFQVLKLLHLRLGIQWDTKTLVWDSTEDLNWGIAQSEIELDDLKEHRIKFFGRGLTGAQDEVTLDQRIHRKGKDLQYLKNKAMIEGVGPDGEFVTFQTESGRTPGPISFRSGWSIEIDGKKYGAYEVENMLRYGPEVMESKDTHDKRVAQDLGIKTELDWS